MVSPPYRLSQNGFPLGLMYIAAVLEKAGHHVEVIDMDVLNLPQEQYLKELKDRDYDYFCVGGMITAWNFVVFSCNAVKDLKANAKVFVGGGIVSSTPKSLVSVAQADVGIIGEGEATILELIDAYEFGNPLKNVPGIVFCEGREVIQTERRSDIENLDALPFPAWDLFNINDTYCRYPSHRSFLKAKRTASIYTSRGCPFQCTFCYTEKAVRQRSIQNVIDEIQDLKERFCVRYINFADDLFVVKKKRTIEFCQAMIDQKVNIKWSATGRCNIIEKDFLKMLKAAGCDHMGLGIESGSDKVLKEIKKSQTPEQIVNAVRMVQEAGITPGGTFILGLPPETKETFKETVELYKQINTYRTHVNRFFFATPYPGTPLYDEMKWTGKIGNELKYFERISECGDAVDFIVNCTANIRDDELKALKFSAEHEVFSDFRKKHPYHAMYQYLLESTGWGKIQNSLIAFKMLGVKNGIMFMWKKLLARLGLTINVNQKHWNKKTDYLANQVFSPDSANFSELPPKT
jgi:anaerobic magnesium-protoporphyrin IX monomethyl ester cyclase